MVQRKNVFISHIHEDDDGLKKLKTLLNQNGMEIRDSSINSERPNNAKNEGYIKNEILAPAIKWAGTFICYISSQTKNSDWVNWEIEYAAKQGKRIVGIWEFGQQECEIPNALKEYADALVGWNGSSIINAINGKDKWENPNGQEFSTLPIKRHPC